MGSHDSPQLISTDEAAQELGIQPRRVRQLIDDGVIPAVRVGRSLVIDRRHLAAARGRKTKRGRAPKPKP